MLGIFLAMLKTEEEQKRFKDLFFKYKSTVYNYAYQILGNAHDSEDVVDDTFLSLSRNMDKIKGKSETDARNYLIVIAKNNALRMLKKRNNMVCVEKIESDTDFSAEDIHLELNRRDLRDRMLQSIKNMNEKYSDVVILKYYYQFGDAEIAQELGLTLENVKIRLHRAKNLLKDELEKEGLYSE